MDPVKWMHISILKCVPVPTRVNLVVLLAMADLEVYHKAAKDGYIGVLKVRIKLPVR